MKTRKLERLERKKQELKFAERAKLSKAIRLQVEKIAQSHRAMMRQQFLAWFVFSLLKRVDLGEDKAPLFLFF